MTQTLLFADGRRIDVTFEIVLGREGDVLVEDDEVSRRHAVLRPSGEAAEIQDLGSRNGTFVNGERIDARTRLAPGDEVRLGTTMLTVEGARSTETRIAAPPASAGQTRATPVPTTAAPAAPAAVAAPAATATPPVPALAPFAPPASTRRSSSPATRLLAPAVLAYAVVIAVAAALIAYFATR